MISRLAPPCTAGSQIEDILRGITFEIITFHSSAYT